VTISSVLEAVLEAFMMYPEGQEYVAHVGSVVVVVVVVVKVVYVVVVVVVVISVYLPIA
jgi:hypothetical protein